MVKLCSTGKQVRPRQARGSDDPQGVLASRRIYRSWTCAFPLNTASLSKQSEEKCSQEGADMKTSHQNPLGKIQSWQSPKRDVFYQTLLQSRFGYCHGHYLELKWLLWTGTVIQYVPLHIAPKLFISTHANQLRKKPKTGCFHLSPLLLKGV